MAVTFPDNGDGTRDLVIEFANIDATLLAETIEGFTASVGQQTRPDLEPPYTTPQQGEILQLWIRRNVVDIARSYWSHQEFLARQQAIEDAASGRLFSRDE